MASLTAELPARGGRMAGGHRLMESGGVVWLLVIGLVLASSVVSEDFRSVANLSNVTRQAVVLSLVALGQFVVVLTGGVDLSLGMIVRLSAIATAITIGGIDERTPMAIAIALALGLLLGGANGAIVTWLRVPAFIATFGTLAVVQGISLLIAATPSGRTAETLSAAWGWQIGPLFGVVAMTTAVWMLVAAALHRTVWGRHIYAVGGDERIAMLSGVRVRWVRLSAFVVAGALAAVAGILTAARAGVGDPNAGFGLEFESLAAVVIGGASLAGGRGRLLGVLGGVVLLTVTSNVFNLIGIDVWYQQLLKGALILVGAAAYVATRDRGHT